MEGNKGQVINLQSAEYFRFDVVPVFYDLQPKQVERSSSNFVIKPVAVVSIAMTGQLKSFWDH